nr:FecR domain-containing protein [Thauera linaloolentis]
MHEPSHAMLQQAAEWYARLRDGKASIQDQAAWQKWLQAADEHQAAWRHVEEISRGFEPLRDMPDPRLAANELCAANDRRRTLAGVATLAGSGLLGWLGWREAPLPASLMAWTADYRTAIGEQRDITLADGTRLWLNTATAIDVRFTPRERRVALVAGEIFIDTAEDGLRPFMAETPHGRMRALGTRFDVRLEDGETRLAVYEGTVEIRTSANGGTEIIPAGQQVRFTTNRITPPETTDIAREAWTRGTLAAADITLREVVHELRRYRRGHLGVADEIAGLKVYGNFPIHDTDRVLRMLASALPIRIEQPLPWWTSIEPARHPDAH